MWKVSRDLSLKAKIHANYGANEDYYDFIRSYKSDWFNYVAYIDENTVKKHADRAKKLDTIEEDQLNLENINVTEVDVDYLKENFKEDISLDVVSNKTTTTVNLPARTPVSIQDQTKRNAFAISVGGMVVSIQWLPQNIPESEVSYLAVSLTYNPDGVNLLDPEFSIYNKSNHSTNKSAIQIWKYDVGKNELDLEHVLITSNHGTAHNLKWVPLTSTETTLGVLAAQFTDGTVKLLKINKNLPKISILDQPSLSYSLSCTKSSLNITAYDFIGTEKILVGATDGSLSEFMLPFHYQGTDIDIPSYKTVVCAGPISSVCCALGAGGKYLCLIYSIARRPFSFIYDNSLQDVYTSIARRNTAPGFNYVLQNLVHSTLADVCQIFALRSAHSLSSSLTKLDSQVICTRVSEVLGHPFFAIGSSNGDVVIVNYMRKYLSARAAFRHTPLKIWKFLAPSNSRKQKEVSPHLGGTKMLLGASHMPLQMPVECY
ncbi:hypothetical protein G210_5411 [Candida maltosa Xu316]|uniref:Uncharacterized protein n=1 Tax=Candida maltosa (strain Xu316) TaxID=1245528 RepID=M3JC81_CANMX|nr:hypothetical protein G210_5411 [Candida maltosa Xu316]